MHVQTLFHSFLRAILDPLDPFGFEEPQLGSCHSLGKFPFIIYLIDFFHLLVSFTLLLNMFYLINTSIFNLLSDSSYDIFEFFFSSALWVSSILLDRSLIWFFKLNHFILWLVHLIFYSLGGKRYSLLKISVLISKLFILQQQSILNLFIYSLSTHSELSQCGS